MSKILSLAVSRAYSFFVTGGEVSRREGDEDPQTYIPTITIMQDHVAIIWDLNKRKYVRTLRGHDSPVTVVAINDNTVSFVDGDEVSQN